MKTIKKYFNMFISTIFYLAIIGYTQCGYADNIELLTSISNNTLVITGIKIDELSCHKPTNQEIFDAIISALNTENEIHILSINFTLAPEIIRQLRELAAQRRLIFQEYQPQINHNNLAFPPRTPPLNLNRVIPADPSILRSRSMEIIYPPEPPPSPSNNDTAIQNPMDYQKIAFDDFKQLSPSNKN